MTTLSDVKDGVKTVLEAANTALKVYTNPPAQAHESGPWLVIMPQRLEYNLALRGDSIDGQLRLTVFLTAGDEEEGWDELDKYVSPTGTQSIRAGVRTDRTLNGKVGDADIIAAENIGHRELFGGNYFAADFILRYLVVV